jgi:hypothetical protein
MLQFLGALFFRGIFATSELLMLMIILRCLSYATVFLDYFFCKFKPLSRSLTRMDAFVFLAFGA